MEGVVPALRVNVPRTRRDYDAPRRQDCSCIPTTVLACPTYVQLYLEITTYLSYLKSKPQRTSEIARVIFH